MIRLQLEIEAEELNKRISTKLAIVTNRTIAIESEIVGNHQDKILLEVAEGKGRCFTR